MPRQRNPENRGLPARWRFVHGAYYYQVPLGMERFWDGKKLFPLGKRLPEAYKLWADRLGSLDAASNIGQLLDRYALEVIPTKAPKTQSEQTRQISKIRAVFGHMPLLTVQPKDIYKYVDKRVAKVAAHREIALLKHAFTKAVEWGYINRHPFKGEVRLAGEKPRTRYIEDWEIEACLGLPEVRKKGSVLCIKSYIRLKLLTGLRRSDLLSLRISDIGEEGLSITTKKTGKRVIYSISSAIEEAVNTAKNSRPVDISPYLFCKSDGKGYIDEKTGTCSGWDSMWNRFMARVIKETKVTERFTEHDLRAKVGSDAESLERARQLLTHADSKITNRVYRRKPEVVRPTK